MVNNIDVSNNVSNKGIVNGINIPYYVDNSMLLSSFISNITA